MENKHEAFHYTYSAQQQEEILHIRSKYTAPEEDKMEQLRRLDRLSARKAQTRSITVGTVGALILGAGMSLIMTDLSGLSTAMTLLVGIPVGLAGIVLVALAYPIHQRVLKRERQKLAPEILRLTDELMR